MDQAGALAVVQAYCGWHVSPEVSEVLTLDGPGTGTLILPTLHVVDIASITENGTVLDPATDYEWSASGMVRRTTGSYTTHGWAPWWGTRYRSILVDLTHGYNDMPVSVQGVIDQLVARSAAGVPAGLASRSVGPFTENYASSSDLSSLTAADRMLLDAYKLPPLAGLVRNP